MGGGVDDLTAESGKSLVFAQFIQLRFERGGVYLTRLDGLEQRFGFCLLIGLAVVQLIVGALDFYAHCGRRRHDAGRDEGRSTPPDMLSFHRPLD